MTKRTAPDGSILPCTIDGCDKLIYYAGLCKFHMNRKKTAGDPLAPKPPRKWPTTICDEPRCPNLAIGSGRQAFIHYNKCLTHHTEKKCPQCGIIQPINLFHNNKSQADGKCSDCKHCVINQARALKNRPKIEPLHERPCYICEQWLDPAEFSVVNHNYDGLSNYCRACSATKAKDVKWTNIEKNWKLTREEWEELAKDGCMICGSRYGKLCVDHDHLCCPGGSSCGQCIRGILCWQHNIGLGYFKDDPVLLEKAIQYLQNAPGEGL